jgi:hypothetical protein
MNRRQFVQAGASSLLLSAAVAASADPRRRGRAARESFFFFDERFAEARRLAGELAGLAEWTPVQADVTSLWTGTLTRASLAAPLALRGVTTESFYFCLKVLLADQCRVDAQVRRIDRDLHLWTIRTNNHTNNGTQSWQTYSRPV